VLHKKTRKTDQPGTFSTGLRLLFFQEGIDLIHQLIRIAAMYGARLFKAFTGGGGAAQAVHAELHQNAGGAAMYAKDFAYGHGFIDRHGLPSLLFPSDGIKPSVAIILPQSILNVNAGTGFKIGTVMKIAGKAVLIPTPSPHANRCKD
jgi:hypothetical protein